MPSPIQVDVTSPLITIRIARPEKKNSLTAEMYRTMVAAMIAAKASSQIKAILLLGEPGAFCAGNDIQDFRGFATGGALGSDVIDFLKVLAANTKPLIAAVDGFAIGIGTTALLHCDYVVATPRASFSTPFVNLGLVPEAGSSLLFPRLLGHVRAFEMLAMGRGLSPEKALAAGLINEIVPAGEADEAARKVALEIAAKPAEAVAITRRLLRGDPAPVLERIDEEVALFSDRLRSEEAKQAFSAFLNRK